MPVSSDILRYHLGQVLYRAFRCREAKEVPSLWQADRQGCACSRNKDIGQGCSPYPPALTPIPDIRPKASF